MATRVSNDDDDEEDKRFESSDSFEKVPGSLPVAGLDRTESVFCMRSMSAPANPGLRGSPRSAIPEVNER